MGEAQAARGTYYHTLKLLYGADPLTIGKKHGLIVSVKRIFVDTEALQLTDDVREFAAFPVLFVLGRSFRVIVESKSSHLLLQDRRHFVRCGLGHFFR